MACHICGNNAVGLCRQCFKFYCQEHGDDFCSSCQQQGWEIERFTGMIGKDVEGVSTAASLSVTEGPGSVRILNGQGTPSEAEEEKQGQETPAEAGEKKAEEEKQPKDRWQTAYHRHGPDQETIDALTEPAKFVGLLPVFGASRLNDVLMLFKGIELYEEAFIFELSISLGSQSDNGMMHRHPMLHEVTPRDDVGTVYQAHQRSGSGSEHGWIQRYFVASPLNPTAKQLTLEIPRLQIMEHIFRGRGWMQPGQIFLNGPWVITCTVPPPDERIVLQ